MIDVRSLSYTYAGRTAPAVRDLSFSLEKGEIFGFLGPSGAGKSTTQRILIRLLHGYSGSIKVLGRELSEWRNEYYERIGVSFELPNHYQKLTALENLRLFASLYKGKTRAPQELLELVGLAEDADTRVGAFSKGMQIRLNFARSLLNYPDLLFLDEPTAGLDPGNARRVKEQILALKDEGRTVLLTTHDMQIAGELCDHVAFIVDGEIAAIDTPRALKLKYGKSNLRVEYRTEGRLNRAEFPLKGLAQQQEFMRILSSESVETMHTEEASLEEIFLQVTGRSLS